MNIVKIKTFTANATIGLNQEYSKTRIPLTKFKEALLSAQQNIYQHYTIGLSVKVSPSEILFLGQAEPSVDLQFIQYPKFLQEEALLKNAIVKCIEIVMLQLQQNRVVIVFTDETIMLEQKDAIDPNIKF